mmetsp:Transcript_13273/g.24907  ORF Transcript_13273/g.24907 Transcript_13273/m.24907 type:complete len:374 (+) Transcript_13273:147-1268(+)
MKCTAYIYQTNNSEVALPRSSHGISFYSGKLYVHGGEHVARTPISSDVLSVSLLQGQEGQAEGTPHLFDFKVETVSGDIPPPRVGHAQVRVENQLYIFGGRQGIHMDEAPMNDLYALDLDTMVWKEIKTAGSIPCSRSYHCIAAGSEEGGAIYVFGGCGESGRLSDVYRLNLNDMTWENIIATDHIKGRGGANFFTSPCANLSGSSKGDTLYVIAGFIGAETNDVYSFDPFPSGSDTTTATSSWKEEIKASGNFRPRSVCAHCNVQWKGKEYLAVFGGEVSPSDKGHEGAGGFANDLLLFPIDSSSGRLEEPISVSLAVDAKDGGDSMIVPRGWTMMCQDDSVEGRLVVFGGLSGSDEEPTRLNDVIVMQLSD